MKQINVRNPEAVALIERLAIRTGRSRTAVVLAALEAYEADMAGATHADPGEIIAALEAEVHAGIAPAHRGRRPTRDEIARELGMP